LRVETDEGVMTKVATANTADVERAAPERLHRFASEVLRAVGMSEEDARTCADAMVWSDLRGASIHGVTGRLPQAVDRIRAGGTNPSPRWAVVRETPGSTVLDADGGWGQVAGSRGMRLAVEKARANGVGVTIVRRSDVTAAMGWYPMVAVTERMLGLAINNTAALMPPWGGTGKLLGNQAFAIGAPAGRHPPILFDSALAAISHSGIHEARQRGEALPPGVALTAAGEPTTDPAEAIAGMVLPMGGHRGSGLAIMWEVMTGVLAGWCMTPEVGGPQPVDAPMGLSLFLLAIDPTVSMPFETFTERMDLLIDRIHVSPPADGVDHVRLPGERGHEVAESHRRDGVPVPLERAERLRAIGRELGVAWDR
jgi:LDH2 family malate/lactate/ureidoglycolate dehydrogenase